MRQALQWRRSISLLADSALMSFARLSELLVVELGAGSALVNSLLATR